MPEPLSIYQRRVERLERELQAQRRLVRALFCTTALGVLMVVFGILLGVWSGLRGWDAGGSSAGLIVGGVFMASCVGLGGVVWWDVSADKFLADELEEARDDYDRAVERTVRDA